MSSMYRDSIIVEGELLRGDPKAKKEAQGFWGTIPFDLSLSVLLIAMPHDD